MRDAFNTFSFSDYRLLIREAIKSRRYSYRSFALKHGDIVSFGMLAGALSRGRGGTKSKPLRNFSLEKLTQIGKALKLSDDELKYLLLLKLENDCEVFVGPHGSACSDLLKRMLAEQQERTRKKAHSEQEDIYSLVGLAVAKLVEALPEGSQRRLIAEILPPAKAILSRQRKKPGVRTLALHIERLEELAR